MLGGKCGASEARAAAMVLPVVMTSSINTIVLPERSLGRVAIAKAPFTLSSRSALGKVDCATVSLLRMRIALEII